MGKIVIVFCLFITCLLDGISAQECQERLDLIFIVDSSLSIRESNPRNGRYDNWELIKEFIAKTTQRIKVGQQYSRVGVVKFSTEVDEREVFYLEKSETQDTVVGHIISLSFVGGNTNTSGALKFVSEQMFAGQRGDRNYVEDMAVLLTDGLSNVDRHLTTSKALRAKMQGIRIFTIGVTKYADGSELEEVASDPAEFHVLRVEDFSKLNGVIDLLLGRICTLRPPPETPCRNSKIDLGILMDESGSIYDKNPPDAPGNYNWELMKQFVAAIINSLNVNHEMARVSVMKFSSRARIQFYLDDYDNKEEMVRRVHEFQHLSGATNTSGALRTLRESVYHPDAGDRPDVANIGIIVTDGESTVDKNLTKPEAALVKQAGITMFAIGITNQVDFDELVSIASDPPEEHVLQSTDLTQVASLVSRLVWSVCNEAIPCRPGEPNCTEEYKRCKDEKNFRWLAYPNHLLLGHNHARLQKVTSVEQCKSFCLQDPKCRSIDFIKFADECSISYITKEDQPMDFVEDSIAEYHQWVCLGEADENSNPGDVPGYPDGQDRDDPYRPGSDNDLDSGRKKKTNMATRNRSASTIFTALVILLMFEMA